MGTFSSYRESVSIFEWILFKSTSSFVNVCVFLLIPFKLRSLYSLMIASDQTKFPRSHSVCKTGIHTSYAV